MPRRVVITGMGWVTPLGCATCTRSGTRLTRGESGFGRVRRFDASTFATNFAAEAPLFELADVLPAGACHEFAGVSTRFALAAARDAWTMAGLNKQGHQPERTGTYLGAGEGMPDFDNFVRANLAAYDPATRTINDQAWTRAALAGLDVHLELEQEPNATVAHVAREFDLRGPAMNCMTACAASTQAIGEAYELIRRGDADAMLAGGTHSMIHPLGMTGFIRLTAMSTRRDSPHAASRPFDANRDGFVMGEGAGMLVLEDAERALTRGATPLAEIAGFGSSADAFRITDIQPDGKGAISAMMQACRQAGINPREPGEDGRPQVQYVSAHGTGTQENDRIETLAVKGVFGPLAPKVPFSSVKSVLGHLIQAAGAVELMTCVMAMQTGVLPPTMNLSAPDPECDLDYVANGARDVTAQGGVHACLSNSFGFGGQNNTLCVRRWRA